MLRLGESVERARRDPRAEAGRGGRLSSPRSPRSPAREGVERLEVLVTSPGRQAANGDELLERLEAAARCRCACSRRRRRAASRSSARSPARGAHGAQTVAVCDVGGGSAQVTVGTRRDGPGLDPLDRPRLAAADEPRCSPTTHPATAAIAKARAAVERELEEFSAPTVGGGFAVGGSARALRRLYGSRLGGGELTEAVELLSFTPASELSARFGVSVARAATLPAGAVILEALQARLEVPLKVSRTGLRHGALLELAAQDRAAA